MTPNPKFYYFPISEKTLKPLKGWQKVSSNDPDKIRAWRERWPRGLFGVDCGKSGLTVLDIDKKGGKDGDNPLASLQFENELLPETLTVKTPSGGRHLYFYGKTRNRVALKAPGLDVRSVGGYVLAPGCVKNGGAYEIVNDRPIHNAPGWLLSVIGQPNERNEEHAVPLVEYDLPHNVQKAINYLNTEAPEAVEGERDATCYKVACRVRDFGISESMCQELMVDMYSSKVYMDDSFGADDIRTKVESAYSYANDRPGNDTSEAAALVAAEAFGGVTGEDLPPGQEFEEALPESQWLRMSDFIGKPAPEREWIIENWLPCGFSTPTLITGDGGTGKSLLAMQLAIAVSRGEPWLGKEVLKKMTVAMVMCEDSQEELHRRVEAIHTARSQAFTDLENADVHFMSRVGKDCVLCREDNGILKDGPFMQELHQQLKHLGPQEKLLIIDTVADIYAGNESNRTSVNHFIKYKLCGLANAHNATIIVIAHPPKSGATYSGSTAWNNSVRNRLYLGWKDDKDKNDWRVLSVEKSNYAQAGTKIILKWDAGTFAPVEVSCLSEMVEELVYNEIEAFNTKSDVEGTFARLSAKRSATNYICRRPIFEPKTGRRLGIMEIRDALSRLIDEGRVAEVKSGKRPGLTIIDHGAKWEA